MTTFTLDKRHTNMISWGEKPHKDCPDKDAAYKLKALMSDISEDYYAAGWLAGLEFDLWAIVFEGVHNPGFPLTMTEISGLLELSFRCKGWWIWDNDHGETFVTYDQFCAINRTT